MMSDKQFYRWIAFIYFTIIVMLLILAACIGSYQSHDYTMSTENPEPRYEEVIELEYPEPEYEPAPIPAIRLSNYYEISFADRDLLQQLAMAEARGEDAFGQACVMRVVLNRAEKKGLSIQEIIYSPGQFATESLGHYIPNDNCNEALEMILNGWDETQGAIYFCADGYNGKEPLFKYGGHYFSKGASR